jgi:pyruvate ferredoxin oxidoreductase gamma subunit/2-oxoisovalerate ferredoxin oxidoreductase gamma subunit
MIEIRLHGRGGQGTVVASMILARAAHLDGYHVQAFPEFGVERRGAPVAAFARLDNRPIRNRSKIYHADFVVVMDEALPRYVDVTAGLMPDGTILINSAKSPSAFADVFEDFAIATVDATGIAADLRIGTPTSPIVNTAMVGALAHLVGPITPQSVEKAIRETLPDKAEANAEAARRAARTIAFGASSAIEALLEHYAVD